MTTPAQTAPTLTSAALRAAKAVVVLDDERFTLGPCRLVVNVGKDGDRSYTVYSRRITKVPKTRPALDELLHAASEPHRFEAASALPERKDALAVMMRIAAMADSDVAEALEDIVEEHAQARARELYADERAAMLRLVRDNVEELPQDVGPVEAVRVAMEVLSGLRAASVDAVPTTTDSADVLPMLRQALNVRPGSFTPAQLVEEVRLMREHADERYAQLKSLRQRLHLADSATKQAEQERDKALATLREQAQAEAAHDNAAAFHDRRTQAIHAALLMVAFNESQSQPARLVMSWLAGQVAPPDDYVSETVERALHLLGQPDAASEHRARRAITDLQAEAVALIRAQQGAQAAAK